MIEDADRELLLPIVQAFQADIEAFTRLGDSLVRLLADSRLKAYVHSYRARVKDPDHLLDKLHRKLIEARAGGGNFEITAANLFEKITDLVGVRLLHLHTSQFPEINARLTELLLEERFEIIEGPRARVWDDEYRQVFKDWGIETKDSGLRLYTSVHYIVKANSKKMRAAEIQVRTLAEELWGEVDHTINYPHPSKVVSCREQLKVLARVTSGCTRLVDSIMHARDRADEDQ